MNCLLCFRTPLTHSTTCLREQSVNRPPTFLLIWETRVQVGEHLRQGVLCIPLFYTRSTLTPFNLHPLLSFSPTSSYSLQKIVWNTKKLWQGPVLKRNDEWISAQRAAIMESAAPTAIKPQQNQQISEKDRKIRQLETKLNDILKLKVSRKWENIEEAYCKRHTPLKMYDSIRGIEIGQGKLCSVLKYRVYWMKYL